MAHRTEPPEPAAGNAEVSAKNAEVSAQNAEVSLSVVLPAYNEAHLIAPRLRRLLKHLSRRSSTWEVIVVDDGSTDGTAAAVLAVAAAAPRLRLARGGENRGKGAALRLGFEEARGRVLATTDADLSYALADLDAAVDAVEAGADVAVGNRSDPASRINLPFGLFPYLVRRWISGQAFRWVVRILFGLPARDTQCGLKVFSRRAAGELLAAARTRRFLVDIEILLAAKRRGMRVAEIPVHLRYMSSESSVRMIAAFPRTLWELSKIRIGDLLGRYGPQR